MAGKGFTVLCTASAVLLAALGAATAHAQSTTVGELSTLNSSNILKTAQLAGAQLDAKLDKERTDSGTSSPVSSGEVSTAPQTGSRRTAADDPSPVVKGVFGANGALYATFLYADGSTVDAKQGGAIPGGYTVARLDAEHVALRRAGKTIDVGFSSSAPVVRSETPTNPYAGGVVSMPMIPPMTAAPSLSAQQ